MTLLTFALPLFGVAEQLTLKTSVDKPSATVGDIINYTLTFTYPKTYKFEIPEKPEELGQFTVDDMQTTQKTDKGSIIQDIRYTLTAFTTGTVTIPEIIFKYTDDEGRPAGIKSSPLNVQIESIIAKYGNGGDIRDIKPPFRIKTPFLLILLRIILLAAVAFALYYWYKKYKETHGLLGPAVPDIPPVPPYQAALDALEKLKSSGLVKEGRIKEFYIALSDILRNYLSAVYSVDTLDKTTAEIYGALKKSDIELKYLMEIRELFEECDLVKFAKYVPDEKICAADLDNAVNLVNK